MEIHALKLVPSDIRYLFVQSDSEVPLLFNFIQQELGDFPGNEIKILCSRITSLETISEDI